MAQNANPNVGKGKPKSSPKAKGSSSSKAAAAHTKKEGKISTAKPNSKPPMLASDFDESELLKGLDLDMGSEEEVTISDVTAEAVGEEEKLKPILAFKEIGKKLVLNKTNRSALQAALGNDMHRWPGHKVVLFPAMVQFKDKMVQAVRLRMPTPKGSGGGGLRRKG